MRRSWRRAVHPAPDMWQAGPGGAVLQQKQSHTSSRRMHPARLPQSFRTWPIERIKAMKDLRCLPFLLLALLAAASATAQTDLASREQAFSKAMELMENN